MILWYSFVVQFAPPPPLGGGGALTKGGEIARGGGVPHVTLRYPTRCQSPALPVPRPYPAPPPWTPSAAVAPAFMPLLPGHSTSRSDTIMPRFLDAIPLAGGNQVAGNDFAPSYVCKQGFQGALRRGDKYMAKGKYDKAIVRYESAMKHWFDETGSPGCYYVRDALNTSTATNKVRLFVPQPPSPMPPPPPPCNPPPPLQSPPPNGGDCHLAQKA